MRTIDLVSHTHWDREWYRTFQQFRLRLVHLVDGLLDLLATDPEFKHFMLDGQTIVLDDYLQMRPEAEPTLRALVEAGRLVIGPWHILPDMFLVSPEGHIRNLLEAERQARRFGPKMPVGYMPDSFGHFGQMPQILRGFGIQDACVWRGLDDQPVEFWWRSPDGSRVLMLYLRDSYSNGASLNADQPAQFPEQLKHAADSLAPHSSVSHLLVMYGTDHMEPPRETSKAIRLANERLRDYCVIHSTLPAYVNAVRSELESKDEQIPTVVGELRSSKRSSLLPGVLSTRTWIKQRNHACETALEKWAEPFSTFASFAAGDGALEALKSPSSILRETWRLLMECYPHDSICGCSIDQVLAEMRPRFDQVEQIGEEITRQSLEALASVIDTADSPAAAGALFGIVVFNPSPASRTDVVATQLSLPPGISDFEIVDENGKVIPYQSASGATTDLLDIRVRRDELAGLLPMVHQGRADNLAVRHLQFQRDGATVHVEAILAENADPDVKVWEDGLAELHRYLEDSSVEFFQIHGRTPEAADISFTATDVPSLGWKTLYVRAKQSKPMEIRVTPMLRLLAPLARIPFAGKLIPGLGRQSGRAPYIIQSDCLSAELNPHDSTLTVTDKATGKVYQGLNRFVDGGDCGDTYNFCPPPHDSHQDRPRLKHVAIMRGPVQQRMTVSLMLRVPAGLSNDRKSRSKEMVDIPITIEVMLTNGVPRVDIHTRLDNGAKDHRLRVHFPAPFAVQNASYDGHFEVVQRPVGLPHSDSTWVEEPRPEAPQRAFTSLSDGSQTLTIANRGLREVEVFNTDGDRSVEGAPHSEIALTLLRCVGWLSRDDLSARQGHAGPFLATPKAQMLGEWEFDYSIISGKDSLSTFQQAWDFQLPLRSSVVSVHPGNLGSSASFVRVDHPSFAVTAIKETEDNRGWLVRGYNTGSEEISLTIRPWRKFGKAQQANLAEQEISELGVDEQGGVSLKARAHQIVTVVFSD